MDFSAYPITIGLIVANAIFSIIGFSNAALVDKTIMWPYRVSRERQYLRFITSGFLHADFMHLFFNMFAIWMFGPHIESAWGTSKFFGYYFLFQ